MVSENVFQGEKAKNETIPENRYTTLHDFSVYPAQMDIDNLAQKCLVSNLMKEDGTIFPLGRISGTNQLGRVKMKRRISSKDLVQDKSKRVKVFQNQGFGADKLTVEEELSEVMRLVTATCVNIITSLVSYG